MAKECKGKKEGKCKSDFCGTAPKKDSAPADQPQELKRCCPSKKPTAPKNDGCG